ncbi:CYFA0S40e00254g1_1 [Cyberlindnera fabianii]|uniref:GID complex catalytic subunit 2 n=1 Tax=Cyberlindnera fabianii TaxID=36022 RepID=A0A061BLL5_CYBFA|nr:CYFA0S40e00254g1_1 [Cyberlindnera fabianii]
MTSTFDTLEADFATFASADNIGQSLESTRSYISSLESLYAQLEQDDTTDCNSVKKLSKTWEDSIRKNLKTSNSAINKFGKALEKIEPLDDVYQYPIDKTSRNLALVDNAVRLHLLREGDLGLDIGRVDVMSNFAEMNAILKELSQGNLKSSIEWVTKNAKNSELEFMLHRAQFLKYYQSKQIFKAFEYAEVWFPELLRENPSNLKSVSKLATSILFNPDDTKSPFFASNQVSSSNLTELCLLFSKQFCSHIGFSFESSLFTIILAAHIAFPFFSKLQKIKVATKLEWTSRDELPIEIQLPNSLKFHAIYICPVFKCETTQQNPAMALPCHHVISKQALQNLSKNGGSFKCPYCPVTALASQCLKVQFHAI